MSSFICDPKHFNNVEVTLKEMFWDRDFYFPYSIADIYPWIKRGYFGEQDYYNKEVTEIMDTVRELTVLCVCLQYKHNFPGTLDKEIQDQHLILTDKKGGQKLSRMGLLKALQCLSYQIETKHLKELRTLTPAEENALFFIEEVITSIMYDIICKSDEYNREIWSIS